MINKNEAFLPLHYDITFKGFFSKEENKKLLMAMLNQYLDLGIEKEEDIEFLNTEIAPNRKIEKMPRLDLVVKTKKSGTINVEMQVTNQDYLVRRCYYYNTKLYSKQFIRGEDYSKLKKATSLTFTTFPVFDNTNYINHLGIKNLETNEHLLKGEFRMVFVELNKYLSQKKKNQVDEDLWAELLLAGSVKECDIIGSKGGLMADAANKLKLFSQEEIDSYWPDMYEKAELDRKAELSYARKEGISIGEKRGKIEERKFIINNMLSAGLSKEIIATSVGISLKELDDFLTNDEARTK